MILVDNRIGSAEIAPLLSTSHILCQLEFADFAWGGHGPDGPVNVGTERKSLPDFLNSMTTGRLSGHQLIGLLRDYDHCYVIVEGIWRPNRKTGVLQKIGRGRKWVDAAQGSRRFMARDVYNFINTLQVICGVVVVATANRWETAKWLDSCHGWWGKEWEKHKSHLQWHKPSPAGAIQLVKPNLVARVASQFDGVGWDKARKIGKEFVGITEFMAATKKELTQIEGIGPKVADSIIKQRKGSK